MDEVENKLDEQQISTAETENQEFTQKIEEKQIPEESYGVRTLRKRNDELVAELKKQREMLEQLKQAQMAPVKPDELDTVGDEDYIPAGKVRKMIAREAQKIAAQETEKLIKQQEQSMFLQRLRGQFSDFDDVVNTETLALLEEQDPELAETIAATKDQYKIGLQTYKYIKAAGLQSKVPQARRQKEVEQKLEKNSKTIQTPQAYDKRPMAQAFKMSDTEKKALYEEMMGYAQQAGMGY